jgi:5-methylcytosine-specific restriction protein A
MKIHQGQILLNNELCEIFECSPQGGMRRSHETNSLILVSNHVKSIYDDKWKGDILHYTGMGSKGDQSLSFMQNRTLNESSSNNIEIHLFEVFEEKKYFYQGQVKLKSKPYQERQTDENGDSRNVWMFPLELINNSPARIDFKTIESLGILKKKKTSKIAPNRLKEMVENQPKSTPSKRTTTSETYERDEKVVRYALLRSNGCCELCDKPAPFKKKDGSPFLEVHHIDFLSNGGDDSIDNVSALCPNCHRKMHALAIQSDISKLKSKALKKLNPND